MSEPQRIQRKRTKGWRMPAGAVYVGRPTRWGNPFRFRTPYGLAREPAVHHAGQPWEFEGRISADGARHDYHHPGGQITVCHVRYLTRAETVECYRALVAGDGRWPLDWMNRGLRHPTEEQVRAELAGYDLVCWCRPDQPCHADVLLEIANADPAGEQQLDECTPCAAGRHAYCTQSSACECFTNPGVHGESGGSTL